MAGGHARTASTSSAGSAAGGGGAGTSVQVVTRIRPITNQDNVNIPTRWQRNVLHPITATTLQVEAGGAPPPGVTGGLPALSGSHGKDGQKRQTFSFDRVLTPSDGQATVYSAAAAPLVARFLEGYNVTILAYGQTSSGKSYTMGTSGLDVDYEAFSTSAGAAALAADDRTGIIPRAVSHIFDKIRDDSSKSGAIQYTAKVSFVEIYNEDLIDLLADSDVNSRPLVQIREDKAGHIIWSGLREVKVQSVVDVMGQLRHGSSLRRTNETDMNAQSSRSHAIFSLTLTQRKYVGSNPPPPPSASHSSHPPSAFGNPASGIPAASGRTTPTGMVPPSPGRSGIARPTSVMGSRVASPTLGSRPTTPSLGLAVAGSGIPGPNGRNSSMGLRPASMAVSRSASPVFGGRDEERPAPNASAGATDGEWVTVTSKFHFVDLAGSERLKRTAAQGERVKEGISINAGLHALGNVISALGDPVKAKHTTHIPYRDSKLTRLLQDSLGGNAHTLMIACVSPAEYNVSETINTLKYANRARNIKNKAELNEVEVGWEDVEYLQAQVLKLRKELAALKEAKATGKLGTIGEELTKASQVPKDREILELQDQYSDLSQKYTRLTAELAKAQSGRQQAGVDKDAEQSFAEAAEPIIEEYEKTIDVLESQMNLMKAALSHSEELIQTQEDKLAEQEERLASSERDLESREATIEELKGRLSKLHDRETTADGYARDLESRLQAYASRDDAESAVVAELRKEVSRHRETEATNERYIKDLEARLAKSEDATASLSSQIDRLEREVARREEAYRDLQSKFELLDTGAENKLLLEELDAREQKSLELERRIDELVGEKEDMARERNRLKQAAEKEEERCAKLEERIRSLESRTLAPSATTATAVAAVAAAAAGETEIETPPVTPGEGDSVDAPKRLSAGENTPRATPSAVAPDTPPAESESGDLREELRSLRESHERTLAELEDLTTKYRDSLKEIEDLANQLREAKLVQSEAEDVVPSPSTPSAPRSRTSSTNSSSADDPVDRLGPMQSHMRASPRSGRRLSEGVRISPKRSPFLGLQTGSGMANAHVRSQSLSQELSSAQSPRYTWSSAMSPLSPSSSRTLGDGLPATYERQILSLEKETMRLQEVLKEREEEIDILEKSLKEHGIVPHIQQTPPGTEEGAGSEEADGTSSSDAGSSSANAAPSTPKKELSLSLSLSHKKSFVKPGALTPATEENFSRLKADIEELNDRMPNPEQNESHLKRLDELMRSMARKETAHRETVDALTEELTALRKEHETLQALNRDQVRNMSTELEGLREQLSLRASRGGDDEDDGQKTGGGPSDFDESVQALKAQIEAAQAEASKKDVEFAAQLQAARDEAEAALKARDEEHEKSLAAKVAEHVEELQKKAEEHQAAFDRVTEEHRRAIDELKEEHARLLKGKEEELKEEHARLLKGKEEELKEEHARLLKGKEEELKEEHARSLKGKEEELKEEHAGSLKDKEKELKEKHARSLKDKEKELKEEHARSLNDKEEELKEEHARLLRVKEEEFAAQLRSADLARQSLAAESEEGRSALITQLRDEHADQLRRAQEEHEITLARSLASKDVAHSTAIAQNEAATEEREERHAAELAELKRSHEDASARLAREHADAIAAAVAEAHTEAARSKEEADAATEAEHASALQRALEEAKESLGKSHEEAVAALRAEHDTALATLKASHEKELSESSERSREEAVAALRAEHEAVLATVKADHEKELSEARSARAQASTSIEEEMAKLEASHADQLKSKEEEHAKALGAFESKLADLSNEHATVLEERDAMHIELQDTGDALITLESALTESQEERERLSHEVADLREELESVKAKQPENEAIVKDLEEQRSSLTQVQGALAKAKAEVEALQAERLKQDQSLKELQAKVAGVSLPQVADGVGLGINGADGPSSPTDEHPRPNGSLARHSTGKPPPPTPPPSVPPPPLPTNVSSGPAHNSMSSIRSSTTAGVRTSSSSTSLGRNSRAESPTTTMTSSGARNSSASLAGSPITANGMPAVADPKVQKYMEDQEAQIRTLTKQLEHCEADLQANIDLVSTLESALNDSERNLRKSRVQINELTREREQALQQAETLRQQLESAQTEADTARQSVLIKDKELASKLAEANKERERARMQLEQRLDEMSKRKSKFLCL